MLKVVPNPLLGSSAKPIKVFQPRMGCSIITDAISKAKLCQPEILNKAFQHYMLLLINKKNVFYRFTKVIPTLTTRVLTRPPKSEEAALSEGGKNLMLPRQYGRER